MTTATPTPNLDQVDPLDPVDLEAINFFPEAGRGLPSRRWHLPSRVAFYLQASIVVTFLAGSSAPTPLYSLYQREWHFSPITTTVVFGIYALAVLAALLTVGALSDHVGRRPVLLVATAVQALVMLVFATADGVPELMLARIIQGLSTGAAVGAVGAGMLDLNKAKGTIANSVAAPIGTALGAIGSGLLVQYLPAPLHLVYLVLAATFVLQGIGVYLMAESSSPRPGALASLRVQLALPPAVRRPFALAAPALIAAWSLPGLYGSLGPTLVRMLLGHNSFVLGGAALFVLAAMAALTVLLLRNAPPHQVMLFGTVALLVGVAVTLLAIGNSSAAGFIAGTAIAGAGFGGGFQGAIRSIVPLARPHERAGVLSLVYVISYLAMGLPAVLAGFLVVHGGGVLETAREYGLAVMFLAALALLGLAVPRRATT
ncbi:Predicted arabinose efflux permease, MFS family [Frankineae bacterium MT45]|nr:Predicted arabinose efflux permease, MFS family [Frankineae bacterium MT45]